MEQIKLQNINYSYRDHTVLKDLNFELNKGELVCLCGPNGAGKSTLLNYVYEHCLPGKNQNKFLATQVAFLPQKEESLWNYRVYDTILAGRYCHTDSLNRFSKQDHLMTEKVIADFNLNELAQESVTQISGGEFQKVRLARAFNQEADFLLLDEPLTALDFSYCEQFMQLLKVKAGDKGVLVCIHDINLACRFADRIILCGKFDNDENGQFIVDGPVEEVIRVENIKRAYSSKGNVPDIKIYEHPVYHCPQICI